MPHGVAARGGDAAAPRAHREAVPEREGGKGEQRGRRGDLVLQRERRAAQRLGVRRAQQARAALELAAREVAHALRPHLPRQQQHLRAPRRAAPCSSATGSGAACSRAPALPAARGGRAGRTLRSAGSSPRSLHSLSTPADGRG